MARKSHPAQSSEEGAPMQPPSYPNLPCPILIYSDAPSAPTGLGRICRDLATRIATHLPDHFRVATVGYGGAGSRSLSFQQYSWVRRDDNVIIELPEIWKDFAGTQKGILLSIVDASRLLWLADPRYCPNPVLAAFVKDAPFAKWLYAPIDATGPHNALTPVLGYTIRKFDRYLTYSAWAAGIVDRTLETTGTAWLPHGIDTSTFRPRSRSGARHGFGQRLGLQDDAGKLLTIPDDELFIGIVATNQPRKDFGMAIAACAEVARVRKVRLWLHTDVLDRHWSLPTLLQDYGLMDNAIVTTLNFSDELMSWAYSACDVTLGIGLGEGYGYPIAESLACGTPCIHGHYGGAEYVPSPFLVEPVAYRLEGVYGSVRPVFRPEDWALKILEIAEARTRCTLPEYLAWEVLWPRWSEWLLKGVNA
jgi:glycosyltransferase involved in cell wall biosynthesis